MQPKGQIRALLSTQPVEKSEASLCQHSQLLQYLALLQCKTLQLHLEDAAKNHL